MGANYWRGLPIERVPSRIFRAEYARLSSAIDAEKARISARQCENAAFSPVCARSTDASGEGIGEPIEPDGE